MSNKGRFRISLSDLTSVVLTLCAVLVTALVVRKELTPSTPAGQEPREIKDWQQLAATGTRLGSPTAPVQIIEFSDFQCPFCARIQPNLRELRRKYPDHVAIVYRHYPLESIHPHARAAAAAAECAGRQQKFEAYHDLLYAQQASIGTKSWEAFAEESGVPDRAAFRECLDRNDFAERIARDMSAGDAIGVRGTPSLIVNGQMLYGAASLEELDRRVRSAIERSGKAAR